MKRAHFAKGSLDLFEDYRIAGMGVGNFRYAYPRYQTAEDARMLLIYAHNDWAQLLAEAGTVGMALFLAGAVWWLLSHLRMWHRRRNTFSVSLGAASLATAAVMAVHAYSEFNLHIPANVLALALVLALGFAALGVSSRERGMPVRQSTTSMPLKGTGGVLLVAVLAGIIWTGVSVVRHVAAAVFCPTEINTTLNLERTPPLADIRTAIRLEPENAELHFRSAMERLRHLNSMAPADRKRRTKQVLELQRHIVSGMEAAVRRNPLDARYHIQLGWAYANLAAAGDSAAAFLLAADQAMGRAAYHAAERLPSNHVAMGRYWTWRHRIAYPSSSFPQAALARARWHFQKALALERGRRKNLLEGEIREFAERLVDDPGVVLPGEGPN